MTKREELILIAFPGFHMVGLEFYGRYNEVLRIGDQDYMT